jgi:EAL and modified HD-GYP domain-containing signal transduction protein
LTAVIARQPILDARQRIYGYELLFRDSLDATGAFGASVESMTLQTLVRTFLEIGTQAALGNYLGFLNLPKTVLLGDHLEVLPPDRIVIEILETVEVDAEVVARCRELKKRGFRLALDDYVVDDGRASLLDLCDIVKVDLPAVPPNELPGLVRTLRRSRVSLLAEKVEKLDEFEACRELGFELFQGFFFGRPEMLSAKSSQVAASGILAVLRSCITASAPEEVAEVLKPHADLTIRLLRLANSVKLSPAEEIHGIEHAVTFMGISQIRRWLLILLYVLADSRGTRNPLARLAAVRGRALELAAEAVAAEPDAGFLVGMLSLAEPLLGVPILELADQLGLERELRVALVERGGELGGILRAIESLEGGAFDEAKLDAEGAGLPLESLSGFVGRADEWASETFAGLG